MRIHHGDESGDKRGVRFPPLSPTTGRKQRPQHKAQTHVVDIKMSLSWSHARRQSVAMKTYFSGSTHILDDDPIRRLVAYEVACMDRVIPHPNIVLLLEAMKTSRRQVCLVMEAAAASRDDLMATISAAPEGR